MLGDAFCGDESCYDLLGVPRGATTKHIRKVYRLKVEEGDRLPELAPTDRFQRAYEILVNDKSRALYNQYLDNPEDYAKIAPLIPVKTDQQAAYALVSTVVVVVLSLVFLSRNNARRMKRM